MSQSPKPENDPKPKSGPAGRTGPNWLLIAVIAACLLFLLTYNLGQNRSRINLGFFLQQLEERNVEQVTVGETELTGTFRVPPEIPSTYGADNQLIKPPKNASGEIKSYEKAFAVEIERSSDARSRLFELLEAARTESVSDNSEKSESEPPFQYAVSNDSGLPTQLILFYLCLTALTIGAVWFIFRRTREQFMGGGGFLSSFTRSTAKRFEPVEGQITFDDVAGLEGVKADLQEIVDYLSAPEKFQRLGGRVPKGVLLAGPPGTGKTLLARAVAGEAGVAFFSVNGSEFIQMFVGVGASRVRDLFQNAKENSPSIIFVDEVDAVGRQRGAGLGGGHDEREQTLNQILSEMDGFASNDSVIVMAATNRPDVLDPALLRPGRFDRHVTVGRPTLKGREAIFKVHTRDVPLADDVNVRTLAEGTVGLTGADIRNLVNESALWAARNDKNRVEMSDFEYARDKILMGAKREEVMQEDEKRKTAYHEAGHTLGAWFLPGAQRVHKVTIIPRGRSMGSTHIVPSEDRLSMSEHEIRDQLVVLLAGRAAERVIYDETTAGAENDLERATSMARRMVAHWGMSGKIGPVSYKSSDEDPFLGREIHQQRQFSEHTQQIIDDEVGDILRDAEKRAIDFLHQKREELELLTEKLMEVEELSEIQITELIGPSIHAQRNSKQAAEKITN
jgi:cell division protease FtsH